MLSKIKSFVSKTYVFVLLAITLSVASGFGVGAHQFRVTPAKVMACNEDPYLQIVGQVAYFRVLGAKAEDILASDIPKDIKPMVEKAVAQVYASDDLSLVGSTVYAECLNRK